MLARTPKSIEPQSYADLLKIPPRPAALTEAEQTLDKATTELKSAQAIQAAALDQFRHMQPGTIPSITAREVDEAGVKLREAYEAQQLAQIRRDGAKADYEASLHLQVDQGCAGLRDEILDIADRLEEVLSRGVALHAAAAAARVSLRNRLPLNCRDMGGIVSQIRRNCR
ncbi:hypothetical protein [Mesorhizobium sp. CN2-181]|uniref:hypothetical protein n=1 Tax=Mesorhizobium yinganensis TaxID=3157707 RepID=UPI0032B82436